MRLVASVLVVVACAATVSCAVRHAELKNTTPSLVVQFTGLNAVVTSNRNVAAGTADDIRVVLIDSNFKQNPNPHKVTHMPTIEFLKGTIDLTAHKPSTYQMTCENGVSKEWYGFPLAGYSVKFIGPSGPVTLLDDFKYVSNLARIHPSKPKLGRVADEVWDGPDEARERVASRVLLNGGQITATTVDGTVNGGREQVADSLRWNAEVTKVEVWDLELMQLVRTIAIEKSGEIRILNLPSFNPADPLQAYHFREFYELTKLEFNPPNAAVVKRTARPTRSTCPRRVPLLSTDDAFCPPIHLGRP